MWKPQSGIFSLPDDLVHLSISSKDSDPMQEPTDFSSLDRGTNEAEEQDSEQEENDVLEVEEDSGDAEVLEDCEEIEILEDSGEIKVLNNGGTVEMGEEVLEPLEPIGDKNLDGSSESEDEAISSPALTDDDGFQSAEENDIVWEDSSDNIKSVNVEEDDFDVVLVEEHEAEIDETAARDRKERFSNFIKESYRDKPKRPAITDEQKLLLSFQNAANGTGQQNYTASAGAINLQQDKKPLHVAKSFLELDEKANSGMLNFSKATPEMVSHITANLVCSGDKNLAAGDEELAYMDYRKYVSTYIAASEFGMKLEVSKLKYCMSNTEKLAESLKTRYTVQQWTEHAAKAVAPPNMQPPHFPHPMFAPAMNPFYCNPYLAPTFPSQPTPPWFTLPGQHPAAGMPYPPYFMPGISPFYPYPMPPATNGFTVPHPHIHTPQSASVVKPVPSQTKSKTSTVTVAKSAAPATKQSGAAPKKMRTSSLERHIPGVRGGPWIPGRNGEHSKKAIIGGRNQVDVIYVARILHQGSTIPGKLVPEYKNCFASVNGSQIKSREYEVFCDENTGWLKIQRGLDPIPDNAIIGGIDVTTKDYIYIGRAQHGYSITCGKVQADEEGSYRCYVVYGNAEHAVDEFEILVQAKSSQAPAAEAQEEPRVPKRSQNNSNKHRSNDDDNATASNWSIGGVGRFIKSWVKPDESQATKVEFKLTLLQSSDTDYTYVSEKMQKSIMTHVTMQFTKYEIIKIEKVWNTKLYSRFKQHVRHIRLENGNDSNERNLFHGSPKCHEIVEKGFDERHASVRGMYGAGVYFAQHSSKSNQYAFGLNAGCAPHGSLSCLQCTRMMMLCRVALGKMHKCTSAQNFAHAPPGHHSVKGSTSAGNLNYPEYIVYRGEQAFPQYLITYKILQ